MLVRDYKIKNHYFYIMYLKETKWTNNEIYMKYISRSATD